jgi:hypothetical protein
MQDDVGNTGVCNILALSIASYRKEPHGEGIEIQLLDRMAFSDGTQYVCGTIF